MKILGATFDSVFHLSLALFSATQACVEGPNVKAFQRVIASAIVAGASSDRALVSRIALRVLRIIGHHFLPDSQ